MECSEVVVPVTIALTICGILIAMAVHALIKIWIEDLIDSRISVRFGNWDKGDLVTLRDHLIVLEEKSKRSKK